MMQRWQIFGAAIAIAFVASAIPQVNVLVTILLVGVALVAYTKYKGL